MFRQVFFPIEGCRAFVACVGSLRLRVKFFVPRQFVFSEIVNFKIQNRSYFGFAIAFSTISAK